MSKINHGRNNNVKTIMVEKCRINNGRKKIKYQRTYWAQWWFCWPQHWPETGLWRAMVKNMNGEKEKWINNKNGEKLDG